MYGTGELELAAGFPDVVSSSVPPGGSCFDDALTNSVSMVASCGELWGDVLLASESDLGGGVSFVDGERGGHIV